MQDKWARVDFIDHDGDRIVDIGKVIDYQEEVEMYFIETSKTIYSLDKEDFKTADKLVDLLEYDDIVHLVNPNRYGERQWIIENENVMGLVKGMISNWGYEITTIELAENRDKQEVHRD